MSFKRTFGPNGAGGPPPQPSVEAVSDWRKYRAGEGDRAGRRISRIYAVDDDYVIYFIDGELYYQVADALQKDLGSIDALLARINRLLDDNPREGTRAYDNNVSTLELAADAFEMFFSGEKPEALEILHGILDKLQAKEEAQRRLMYQAGTVLITIMAWVFYLADPLSVFSGSAPSKWEPWVLAAVLAMAGGLFSVCLTIGSLEVNVNQKHWFLFLAGATRSVVAFLAGVALLLAMRSKMFAGIVYDGTPPDVGDALQVAEMFFCFLAGFSESFVPNILRDAQRKADEKKPPAPAAKDGQPDGQQGAAQSGQRVASQARAKRRRQRPNANASDK